MAHDFPLGSVEGRTFLPAGSLKTVKLTLEVGIYLKRIRIKIHFWIYLVGIYLKRILKKRLLWIYLVGIYLKCILRVYASFVYVISIL